MPDTPRSDAWWPRDPDREPEPPPSTPAQLPPGPPSGWVEPPPVGPDQPGWALPTGPRAGRGSEPWVPDYGQREATPPGWPAPAPSMPPGPGPYGPGRWVPTRTESTAVSSLVLGILGLLCGLAGCLGIVFGPLAIAFGIIARRRIGESAGMLDGAGLATAGLVCGIIGTVLSIGWVVFITTNPDFIRELQDQLTTTTTTP